MSIKNMAVRLALKYDSYSEWTKNNPVLLAGEAAVVNVPAAAGTGLNEPAVLLKFGDGTTAFNDLPWASGLSADVVESLRGSSPTLPAESITGLNEYIQGAIKDTNTRYQLVADGDMGVKLQSSETGSAPWTDVGSVITFDPTTNIQTAIQALDAAAVTAGAGEIISEVSETDGIVSIKKRSLVAADIPTLTTAKLSDFATAVDGRIDTKVGDIGESADVADFVADSIDTAIGTLNLNAVTAGTGQVIGQIQQTDGAVTAQLKTLAADDIPAIPTSKVTGLDTALAGKQDTLVFNTAYNADTNKAATMTDVQNAVAGLSGAMHYVGVSTTDPSTGTATVEGHEDWVAGDVVTYQSKEFVYDGENWRELGDESSYAIKGSIVDADIAPNANIAQSKIANLVTDLAAKATPADITSAIEALDVASQAVATGSKITAIEQVDGKISVTTGKIVADDIPELPQTKITGLSASLAGKQDVLTMDGTYNAESNKVATQSTVTTAIGALDFDDTAVAHQFITEVDETNGIISVQRAALVADDIPDLTASKITDLDTTISNAIDEAIGDSGAIDAAVDAKLAELDVEDSAVATQLVSAVSQTDGKIAVTRRALVEADIPALSISKVTDLQTSLNAKADATAVTALSGRVDTAESDIDALQASVATKVDDTDQLILNCGSSTVNMFVAS